MSIALFTHSLGSYLTHRDPIDPRDERRFALRDLKLALLFFDTLFFPLVGLITRRVFEELHLGQADIANGIQPDTPDSLRTALYNLYHRNTIVIGMYEEVAPKDILRVVPGFLQRDGHIYELSHERINAFCAALESMCPPMSRKPCFSEAEFRLALRAHCGEVCETLITKYQLKDPAVVDIAHAVRSHIDHAKSIKLSDIVDVLRYHPEVPVAIDAQVIAEAFHHQYMSTSLNLFHRRRFDEHKGQAVWHWADFKAATSTHVLLSRESPSKDLTGQEWVASPHSMVALVDRFTLADIARMREDQVFVDFRRTFIDSNASPSKQADLQQAYDNAFFCMLRFSNSVYAEEKKTNVERGLDATKTIATTLGSAAFGAALALNRTQLACFVGASTALVVAIEPFFLRSRRSRPTIPHSVLRQGSLETRRYRDSCAIERFPAS